MGKRNGEKKEGERMKKKGEKRKKGGNRKRAEKRDCC